MSKVNRKSTIDQWMDTARIEDKKLRATFRTIASHCHGEGSTAAEMLLSVVVALRGLVDEQGEVVSRVVLDLVNQSSALHERVEALERRHRIHADTTERFVTDIGCCARCGEDHAGVDVYRFQHRGVEHYTHYATCPETGEPILIYIEEGEEEVAGGGGGRMSSVVKPHSVWVTRMCQGAPKPRRMCVVTSTPNLREDGRWVPGVMFVYHKGGVEHVSLVEFLSRHTPANEIW